MPNSKPPATLQTAPALVTVPTGTVLFRVHQASFPADSFNPGPSHRYYGGGRFDSTADDNYGYLYAGEQVATAVAETLLRDLPVEDSGTRVLPRVRVRGRKISAIATTTDVSLVNMTSAVGLASVAQDPWLTWADPRDYAQTRHWGHWIRSQVPTAQGYVWPSRREPPTRAFVLFEDRLPAGAIHAVPNHPAVPAGARAGFDTPPGLRALRKMLAIYNVSIART